MTLVSRIRTRDMIRALIAAVDSGEIDATHPDFELGMLALAYVAAEDELWDEVFQLGARTRNGKEMLKRMAQ